MREVLSSASGVGDPSRATARNADAAVIPAEFSRVCSASTGDW